GLLTEDRHHVVASDVRQDERIGLGAAVQLRRHTGSWFGCVTAAAELLPFQPESFDCIYCLAALRHIADLERVFAEAARVLRPGGIFVALEEPYRGVLTTQKQRLQNSSTFMLSRGWESRWRAHPSTGSLKGGGMGSTLYELCRRVPSCLDAASAAGLQAWVLPAAVALALPSAAEGVLDLMERPAWLDAFADAYALDANRLRACLDRA